MITIPSKYSFPPTHDQLSKTGVSWSHKSCDLTIMPTTSRSGNISICEESFLSKCTCKLFDAFIQICLTLKLLSVSVSDVPCSGFQ